MPRLIPFVLRNPHVLKDGALFSHNRLIGVCYIRFLESVLASPNPSRYAATDSERSGLDVRDVSRNLFS
jgi:hypothetical protein